jgi:carboxylesterase
MRSRNLAERLPGWYWYQPELSRGYIKYNQKPIAANLKLIRIINHVPDALPKISAPVLLMGSKKDKIIDSSKMKKVYDSLNVETKEMIWFEKSSHMLPIDGERELVFQKTYEFIEEAVNI